MSTADAIRFGELVKRVEALERVVALFATPHEDEIAAAFVEATNMPGKPRRVKERTPG